MEASSIVAIHHVTIDLASEIVRDGAGNPVILRPQCFAVLRLLIERADRLVTKDELLAAVWPGIAVTDDSLVQCIHEIRRAIGDDRHEILKTIPKRGYRLVVAEEAAQASAEAAADIDDSLAGRTPGDAGAPSPTGVRPRSGRIAAIAAALLVLVAVAAWRWAPPGPTFRAEASTPSIAVLPFTNLGGDSEQGYFADGITEDLITDLSKLSGLSVIARNSTWAYRGKAIDVRAVSRDLGVRYLLEGSVQREGDQVRINAQLIDSQTGHHLWAERYDGRLGDVFALQDKVIGAIVGSLAVKLTSDESAEAAEVETPSAEAYDALLLGLEHLHRDTEDETLKAIGLFERAVALDPNYSRAYAAIAAGQLRIVLSIWITTAGAGLDNAFDSLRTNLAKAMERPTSLAFRVAALWAYHTGRYGEGFALIDKARALAPNDPEVLVARARILGAIGRAGEAEANLRSAIRLDPGFAPGTLRALSITLYEQGRFEEAIDVVERIKAQGAVTTDDYLTLAASLGQLGRNGGVAEAAAAYNALAVPAGWDPISVTEGQWYWNGPLFSYHRPYVDAFVDGLRRAGLPAGAGLDMPFEQYTALVKRVGEGEFDVDGATEIDAGAAMALLDRKVPFVDVRGHGDYASGHVPGAVNLSMVFDLSRDALARVVGPEDEVVFYCHSRYCEYSAYASAKAVIWGYRKVYRFAGGFPAWKAAGYPIETLGGADVAQ